jgi:hypothetical protein
MEEKHKLFTSMKYYKCEVGKNSKTGHLARSESNNTTGATAEWIVLRVGNDKIHFRASNIKMQNKTMTQ